MLLGSKYQLNHFIHLGEGRGSAEGGEREGRRREKEGGQNVERGDKETVGGRVHFLICFWFERQSLTV